MASRYDQHAQLIEERFQRGESFTSIARHLHEHFAIPQDASGLRRWILRRIARREQRLAILSPTASGQRENNEKVPVVRDSSTRKEDISHDQMTGEKKEPPKKTGSLSSLILETITKEESLQQYIKP